MPYVKIAGVCLALDFSYIYLLAPYSLIRNIKSHTKMQSCTTKLFCYQTYDVSAFRAPKVSEKTSSKNLI